MAEYRLKSVPVKAEQYNAHDHGGPLPLEVHHEAYGDDAYVNAPAGRLRVRHLDWVLYLPNGDRIVWDPESFATLYEPVPTTEAAHV